MNDCLNDGGRVLDEDQRGHLCTRQEGEGQGRRGRPLGITHPRPLTPWLGIWVGLQSRPHEASGFLPTHWRLTEQAPKTQVNKRRNTVPCFPALGMCWGL